MTKCKHNDYYEHEPDYTLLICEDCGLESTDYGRSWHDDFMDELRRLTVRPGTNVTQKQNNIYRSANALLAALEAEEYGHKCDLRCTTEEAKSPSSVIITHHYDGGVTIEEPLLKERRNAYCKDSKTEVEQEWTGESWLCLHEEKCLHKNTEWRDENGKSYLNCFDCNEVLRVKTIT